MPDRQTKLPDRQTRCQTKKNWSGFLSDQIFWSGPDRYLPTSDHDGKVLKFSLKLKLMVRFEYFVIESPKKLARKSIEKRLSERKPSPISQFRVFLASHVKK